MTEARAAVRAELDSAGFCVLRSIVPAAKMSRVSAAYDRAFAAATAPELKLRQLHHGVASAASAGQPAAFGFGAAVRAFASSARAAARSVSNSALP